MSAFRYIHILKSKEYREGWNARISGASLTDNPYINEATDDNLKRGMGASPWWDTKHKAFVEWERGFNDAFWEIV